MVTHKNTLIAVILAAGKGTRMRSSIPKVMHPIAGLPMVGHVVNCAQGLSPDKIVVVLSPEMPTVKTFVESQHKNVHVVWQVEQKGTGHAVLCAHEHLQDPKAIVLVLFGDTPLMRSHTLEPLVKACEEGASVAIMAFHDFTQNRYGRVVTDKLGKVEKIVEFKDLDAGQENLTLCNSGVMALRGDNALTLLRRIQSENAAHEYYLTDIVHLAKEEGLQIDVIATEKDELMGINSRAELAIAEGAFQNRLRGELMSSGVTLIHPDSVFLHHDTVVGQDTVIHPHVVFGPEVTLGTNNEIRSFTKIEGAHIGDNVVIGPFAHIRPQSVVGSGSVVGNFAELKNAKLGEKVKACHQSYLGDCEIGDMANIGAGTVTCNFDGFEKHQTVVGKGTFIGANASLVAPIVVGDNSIVGAGSAIAESVEANEISVARPQQQHLVEGARKFRSKRMN